MHQSKKSHQWCFGMKAPIGVYMNTGLVHTVGNVSDISQAQVLLHGKERAVFGDACYQGVEKRPESSEASVKWYFFEKPSKVKTLAACRTNAMQMR